MLLDLFRVILDLLRVCEYFFLTFSAVSPKNSTQRVISPFLECRKNLEFSNCQISVEISKCRKYVEFSEYRKSVEFPKCRKYVEFSKYRDLSKICRSPNWQKFGEIPIKIGDISRVLHIFDIFESPRLRGFSKWQKSIWYHYGNLSPSSITVIDSIAWWYDSDTALLAPVFTTIFYSIILPVELNFVLCAIRIQQRHRLLNKALQIQNKNGTTWFQNVSLAKNPFHSFVPNFRFLFVAANFIGSAVSWIYADKWNNDDVIEQIVVAYEALRIVIDEFAKFVQFLLFSTRQKSWWNSIFLILLDYFCLSFAFFIFSNLCGLTCAPVGARKYGLTVLLLLVSAILHVILEFYHISLNKHDGAVSHLLNCEKIDILIVRLI